MGTAEFDGRPCVVLRLGSTADAPTLFVDVTTWLPRGLRYTARSPLGEMPATVHYRSYRAFGTARGPDHIVIDMAGQQTEVRLTAVNLPNALKR